MKAIKIVWMDRFCVRGLFVRAKTRLTSSKTTAKRPDGRVKKSVAKRQSEYRQRKDIKFTETSSSKCRNSFFGIAFYKENAILDSKG